MTWNPASKADYFKEKKTYDTFKRWYSLQPTPPIEVGVYYLWPEARETGQPRPLNAPWRAWDEVQRPSRGYH